MDERLAEELSKLSDNEWRQICNDLGRYSRLKRKMLPVWQGPDDIAEEAIRRLLSSERNRNAERYPQLLHQLMSIVDSLYYILWKKRQSESSEHNYVHIDITTVEIAGRIDDNDQEFTDYTANRLDALEAMIEQDEELLDLYSAYRDGCEVSREVAEHLGWAVSRVYNARKRLNRVIEMLNNEDSEGKAQ